MLSSNHRRGVLACGVSPGPYFHIGCPAFFSIGLSTMKLESEVLPADEK